MNDMGNYMFTQYSRKWIPDSPARREAIVSTLRTWRAFSNSSPVEGLTAAIRTFYDPNKKIGIYVFGDEFSGQSMQPVIDRIDRINRVAETGERRVRIHAVGFPVMFLAGIQGAGPTGDRFATLMRAVCERNGGAFVDSIVFGKVPRYIGVKGRSSAPHSKPFGYRDGSGFADRTKRV